MYDAIVVGGGISGLTCAKLLAERGFETLVLEKSAQIGGQQSENLQGFPSFEVPKIEDVVEVPRDYGTREFCLWGSDGRKIGLKFDSPLYYLVKRGPNDSFDSHLARESVRAGAQIRLRTAVVGVELGSSCGSLKTQGGETLRSRYVVAADGATSTVRNAVGVEGLDIKGVGYGLKVWSFC